MVVLFPVTSRMIGTLSVLSGGNSVQSVTGQLSRVT